MKVDKPYKNILGWEEIVSNPPGTYKKWFKAEKDFLLSEIKKNAKVLEVGCGDGRSLKDVLEVTKDIVGIDHDSTAVAHAKETFKDFPRIKILLAEGSKIPFDDEMFDFTTCIGTFANLGKERHAVLSEMKRVLKDNGKIIISVYSEDALPERLRIYEQIGVPVKLVDKTGTVMFDDDGKEGISEQFSKERLISIFTEAGLSVEKIVKAEIGYVCLLSKRFV